MSLDETFDSATTKIVLIGEIRFSYRVVGPDAGVPIVMLHHLTAVLEDWDPRTIDALAQEHPVIMFDNRGVGGSKGVTPDNVEAMAQDAVSFIEALGLTQVDLFGYSLGGFVAQVVAQNHPNLVRRIILAGTAPPGGPGIHEMGAVLQSALTRGAAENRHPKELLFFPQSAEGRKASGEFLERLNSRKADRDEPIADQTVAAQIAAITEWGLRSMPETMDEIQQPVFVTTGDGDLMAPMMNSVELARKLPNASLSIFPASGHGAIFQDHFQFLEQVSRFLQD